MPKIDKSTAWLNDWMRDWAEDMARRNGFSSRNAIHRAMELGNVPSNTGFRSQIPKGAEDSAQGHVRRLDLAMTLLTDEGHGRAVRAVKEHYLLGWKAAMDRMGLKKSQLFYWKKEGARLICGKIEEMRRGKIVKSY